MLAAVMSLGSLLHAWYGDGRLLDGPWELVGVLVMGYLLGAWLPAVPGTVVVAGAAVALTAAHQHHDPGAYPVADDLVFFLLMAGAPALAGAALTRRHDQVAELTRLGRRIEAQRSADLEAARIEERQRVEVAVHRRLIEQVGGIVLLAEGARHQASRETTTAALGEIEDASRSALAELREAVGTLRTAPEPAPPHTDRPAPVTADLPQPPPGPRDVVLAIALGGAVAAETLLRDFARGPAWANVLAALVVAAPLVWRRNRPLSALVAFWLLASAMSLLLTPLTLTVTALGLLLVASYAAGAHGRPWHAGLGLTWAGTLLLVLAVPADQRDAEGIAPTLVLASLAMIAGVVAAGAARRAALLRSFVADLEQGRDVELRTAVATTRLELARTLHDSVAQAMTVTCLQSSVGRGSGEQVEATLGTILAVARDCMAELRHGLDELDGEAPSPDTRSLQRLADRFGLEVHWSLDPVLEAGGAAGALVHQVLREALTNVARHSPGSRVRVRVAAGRDTIEVEVVDDGTGGDGYRLGTGTGLRGLSEAVAGRGGSMSAGARPDGGFQVTASVPRTQGAPA